MRVSARLQNYPNVLPCLRPVLADLGNLEVSPEGQMVLTLWKPEVDEDTDSATFASIMNRAEEFIESLNGVLTVVPYVVARIRIDYWFYLDSFGTERRIFLPPEATTDLRYVPNVVTANSAQVAFARAAAQDAEAQKALRFLAPQADWYSIYKAYEVVLRDVGGKQAVTSLGWAKKKEQDLFTRTANSYDALGIEARHGVQREEPPDTPMAYDEACSFVVSLVKRWLQEKVVPRTRSRGYA